MLNISQLEALRRTNPQLYEAMKKLAEASLGPNQGWSIDNQITDGTNFARVTSGALTGNHIDPTKPGVLMKGSVPPTWSGAFTYVSTTSSITWSWTSLAIARADGISTAVPNGSLAVSGLTAATTYYFYPYWDDVALAIAWVAGISGSVGTPANAQGAKTNIAAQQQALQGTRSVITRRDDRGNHQQRDRRRFGRRQRKLSARRNESANERARAGEDRILPGRRTSMLPVSSSRRALDAHRASRDSRCRYIYPLALFE